jgi:GNAT superfamily N-acetyltransferase
VSCQITRARLCQLEVVDIDLRTVGADDPSVEALVGALRDEVGERGAHANESAGELRRPVAEAVQGDGVILVAYAGSEAVGIGALRVIDAGTGEIKRMYVVRPHRGTGVGKRLLEELESLARARGLKAVRLDTHHRLSEAAGLYRAMGYREIADYNGNPSADIWFEKLLA